MKFKLSVVDNSPEETIGNVTNHETAKNLPIFHSESINTILIGKEPGVDGKNIVRYNTGFIPQPIERNKFLLTEEKAILLKAQKEAKARFAEEILGNKKSEIDETNGFFWNQPENSRLDITNETSKVIYDTKNMNHMLLYWQIMSDAFGLVGINLDHAISKNAPYFLQEIKDAEIRDSEEEMNKVDAIGLLYELKGKGDNEALLYLCWFLGDKKDKMAGFSKSTAGATMVKALFNFISGNTKERGKKLAVTEFTKALDEYNNDRDGFMIKVIIKIADFHNYIYTNKDKMYVTGSGILLGHTLDECIEKLKKASNRDILEEITKDALAFLINE